ncbi:MAG TPA: sigma-54 dependent transcriptional regulator [Methylomirabilota bacterium]|jgi:DNA-binding NtrC family response regulator|nr:sigma-54 dependent transcriptional regulator [Methylomirabilota bacterium]
MAAWNDDESESIGGKVRSTLTRTRVRDASEEDSRREAPTPRVLVVDDDPLICQQLERLYSINHYTVEVASSGEKAIERLQVGDIDLVVSDIRLPGMSGVELTEWIQRECPDVPVIVVTGHADISNAVDVLKLGASDYIIKPFTAAAIQESTRAVLEKARVFTEIRHLRRTLKDRYEFGGMLSKTPEMHKVFETIRMVSATDVTVLVEGETGTGKELVASAIHLQSERRKGPFIPINCAGVPETLLESELFGYERGAFTGADQSRPGKIELAHGGTLFLDEIESMSLAMQAKLLLVLQDQRVQRLGSSRRVQIDMRVIAASNVPLEELVAQGHMRSDFYYRINVIPIRLIPLRQRRQDIPLLVQDFLRHHPLAQKKRIAGLSSQAMGQLMQYGWPGNVRELQNVLERAIVLTSGRTIDRVDLPETGFPPRVDEKRPALTLPLKEWLNEQEKRYLVQQLEVCEGKINLAAQSSGIDVKTLYRKMRQHGLDKRFFKRQESNNSMRARSPHMNGHPLADPRSNQAAS